MMENPLIVIANTIVPADESGTYIAYTREDPPKQIKEYGNTPEEALGKLILNHKDRFPFYLIKRITNG